MKKKTVIGVIVLMSLILSCAFNLFIHMNREIQYESLYHPQCIFEESSSSLYFSFVFVDSFLTITDYKLIQKKKEDHINFYITLTGKNVSKHESIVVNKDIKKKNGHIEVVVPQLSFNIKKDEFYYKASGKSYRLVIQPQ